MFFLIVATALRPGKRTARIAQAVGAACAAQGIEAERLDLSASPLPLRDGSVCFQNPGVLAATAQVRSAAATTLCFPVYNHQANAAPKNFAEVTNEGWKGIVVGLVASGGTNRSALVPRSLAHALMVDHRCMIVPRFVVVTPAHFAADGTLAADGETASRLADLSRDLAHLSSHWPRENRTV